MCSFFYDVPCADYLVIAKYMAGLDVWRKMFRRHPPAMEANLTK
jgi:hypothetical protein